jgi:hypothetical protein
MLIGPRSGFIKRLKSEFASAEKRREDAQHQKTEWDALLADLEEARLRAVASGTLSIEAGIEELNAVQAELSSTFGAPDASELAPHLENPDLAGIVSRIATLESVLASRREVLRQEFDTPGNWRAAMVDVRRAQEAADATLAELTEADQRQSELVGRYDRAKAAEVEASAIRSNRSDRIESMRTMARATDAIVQCRSDLEAENARLERLRGEASKHESAALEATRAQRRRLDLEREVRGLEALLSSLEGWAQEEATLRSQQERRTAAIVALAPLQEEQVRLRQTMTTKKDALATAETHLQDAEKHYDALQRALALIVASIRVDDDRCPVCKTPFVHGQLRDKASTDTWNESPLVTAQRTVANLRAETDAEARRFAEVDIARQEHEGIVVEIDALIERQDRAWETFRSAPALDRVDRENAVASVRHRLQEVRQAVLAHERETHTLLGPGMAAGNLESARAEISECERNREKLMVCVRELEEEINRLPHLAQRWTSVDARREEMISAAQDAERAEVAWKEHQSLLARASSDLDVAKARVRALRATLAAQREDADQRMAGARAIAERWESLRIGPEIAEVGLEAARRQVDEQWQHLAAIKHRTGRLREETERAGELRSAQVRAERHWQSRGHDSSDTYSRALQAELNSAGSRLERLAQCKSMIDRLSERLKDAQDVYAKRVADPFAQRANRFFRALSSFHTRELVIESRVFSGNRGEIGLQVALDVDGGALLDRRAGLAAQYILSEGQMSEASLSLLLGMGTGFRWSRWPALLLDDPLQQNDVVHVASFLDVVCNLARFQGYQVIISTHDLDMADFMKRKVLASGVACRLYRFVNPGRALADTIETG